MRNLIQIQSLYAFCFVIGLSMASGPGGALVNARQLPAYCADNSTNFYCYKTEDCKPAYVRCDGVKDCSQGEDEDDCLPCKDDPTKFKCFSDNKCIPLEWRCDGQADCSGREDEAQCDNIRRSCHPETQFTCKDGKCISSSWKCDNQVDCDDGSDEGPSVCPQHQDCSATDFLCPTSGVIAAKCINNRWRCDGDVDCSGGEDEQNCQAPTCEPNYFACNVNGTRKCNPIRWRCDGDRDCPGGEDEANCDKPKLSRVAHQCTPQLEFQCASGSPSCIMMSWRCDGGADCADGSDEAQCELNTRPCASGQFMCLSDRKCIPDVLKCTKVAECQDGSDELDEVCQPMTQHKYCIHGEEFACEASNNTICIPNDKVCDARNDCENNRDESRDLCDLQTKIDHCASQPCIGNNSRCENVNNKYNIAVDFLCVCSAGYELADRTSCRDIDECAAKTASCDQECRNTVGSFACHCDNGYELSNGGHNCKAIGSQQPRLVFANRRDIRLLHIHLQQEGYMPLLTSKSASSIDFDVARNSVFYSDIAEQRIYRFTLPTAEQEHEPELTDLGIQSLSNGIAYDWVYQNLYWTDTNTDTINVVSLGSATHSTVLYRNPSTGCQSGDPLSARVVCIDEPKAIAVHPHKGWIFWSDWGQKPHIARAGMDGSQAEMIVYNTDKVTYLQWPQGLTLDLSRSNEERLYWIDAKLSSVYVCNIESCLDSARLVIFSPSSIKQPYSITVFEDKMYWSDLKDRSIISANKFNGTNITSILYNLTQPMDLKVFHNVTQQASVNHCYLRTAVCEHICVPTPWKKYTFSSEHVPPMENRSICLCGSGHELSADSRSCHKSSSPNSGSHVAGPVAGEAHAVTASSALPVGSIAAITASCILAIGIIIVLAVYCAVRNSKRTRSKSLNFDNPVYKKTTKEDKLELPRNEYQPSRTLPPSMMPLTSEDGLGSPEDYDV